MRSAYPSSQSFFDATSDSIRAEDIHKGRTSASFSSLADLFTNPSSKSDLFPNVRAPVFIAPEVSFPAKKQRECEERTSIWHEWGSGECQTENVAQESSGLLSDLFGSAGSKPSDLFSSSPRSISFPNLGSADMNLVHEEFSFPARKKREEASSWREERASFQDWSKSESPSDCPSPTATSIPVGSITDMKSLCNVSHLLSNSRSSLFSNLGGSVGSPEELSFPARKKREERSFWQLSGFDEVPSASEKVLTPPAGGTSGVNSLAGMYLRKPDSKRSSLFSDGIVDGSEDVIFPKRKNRADRNDWRDWRNTGYSDWEDVSNQVVTVDNASVPKPTTSSSDSVVQACSRVEPFPTEDSLASPDGQLTRDNLSSKKLLAAPCNSHIALVSSSPSALPVDNIHKSPGDISSKSTDLGLAIPDSKEVERTTGGELSFEVESLQAADHCTLATPRSRQETSSEVGKYPPPLRSLGRHGCSRVPHHMPWVQLQPIRSKGRFMLQEVKVTHPVVFQPIRKEGRLVLQLIGQDTVAHNGGHESRRHGNGCVRGSQLAASEQLASLQSTVAQDAERANPTDTKRLPAGLAGAPVPRMLLERTEESGVSSEIWPELEPLRNSVRFEQGLESMLEFDSHRMPREVLALTDNAVAGNVASAATCLDSRSERNCLIVNDHPQDNSFSASSESERLALKSDVGFHRRSRDNENLKSNSLSLPRTLSMRNDLSRLSFPCSPEGEVCLSRSRSVKSSPLCDYGVRDFEREEVTNDGVRVAEEMLGSKASRSIRHGIREASLNLCTADSFLRSFRTPDVPGDPDSRLSSYAPIPASFSCADGIGKRHHEKRFWEHQPCVS